MAGWDQRLARRIVQREARTAVIGLGYVGLPLIVELARAGYEVVGIDADGQRIDALRSGRSYIGDVPDKDVAAFLVRGRARLATDDEDLGAADTIHICVPTPLCKSGDPDISHIVAVAERTVSRLHPGQLVVLESTSYPGTTEEVLLPRLVATGLRCGQEFFLAFAPERVDPGNRAFSLRTIPRLVGGVTPACGRLATLLYSAVTERVITVSSPRVAEMAKLLENTFRSVNIALANEMALLCDRLAIDIWEVIDAAATKPFGFMPFYPGPGLGGHCIPIDPVQLSWKARRAGMTPQLVEIAAQINARMPFHVVQRVIQALNRGRKALNGATVLMLGVTYKENVADLRESPALDVMRLLEEGGARVEFSDPWVDEVVLAGRARRSLALTAEVLRRCDVVVIAAAHRSVDYDLVLREAAAIVDARNALRDARNPKVVRL